MLAVGLVLGLISLTFVVYPLFKGRTTLEPPAKEENEQVLELASQRDSAYAAIKELEFEHEIGSLSDDDFQDLDQRYKTKAVTILKELDSADQGQPAEDELEAAIRRRRTAQRSGSLDTELEAEIRERRAGPQRGDFCTQCGAKSQAGNRFCSACGAKLS